MWYTTRRAVVLSMIPVFLFSAYVSTLDGGRSLASEVPDAEAAELVGGCYVFLLIEPAVCVANTGTRCPIDSCQKPVLTCATAAFPWPCGGCCEVPMPGGTCGIFYEDPQTNGDIEE